MSDLVYDLHVPFKPTPQKRHRHTRTGRTYDPCCQEKQAFLKLALLSHHPGTAPFPGPLRCHLVFTFRRPKSHCTAAGHLKKSAPTSHVYKPDVDNLAKFVLDALNGFYYVDDSQIHCITIQKKYGTEDSISARFKA